MVKQLLHLVFGGELKDPSGVEFADLDRLDIVGIYPNYQSAYEAWRGAAQKSVDASNSQWFSSIGPFEGFGQGLIEVVDELNQRLA